MSITRAPVAKILPCLLPYVVLWEYLRGLLADTLAGVRG